MPDSTEASSTWIRQRNPLTDGLPRFPDLDSIAAALAFDPLAGIDVKSLDIATRIGLLNSEKSPLQPTSVSVQCALAWQGMLLTGLDRRNPLNNAARLDYWQTLMNPGRSVSQPPKLPSKGMAIHVVKGPTGTGKSVTADRFCALYPQQAVERAGCEAAGFKHLLQLIYLQVDMSADGTRGGFITGTLLQMDRALGTNYAASLKKQFRTVEQLTVALIARLIAHHTGILFIDEGQLRNLVQCGHADLIQLFLLQLMNSGIPTVFVGNERAFDWVKYSQDLSRLKLIPGARFSPPGSLIPGDPRSPSTQHAKLLADADAQTLVDGIMSYYLLKESPQRPEECIQTLLQHSGSIARLGLTLWTSAQLQALLLHGREYVAPEDIKSAYNSTDFDALRPLADGINYRKPELFAHYPDVASAFYRKIWGFPADESASATASARQPTPPPEDSARQPTHPPKKPRPGKQSGKSKLAAEETREANAAKERERLEKTLKEEDMRKNGLVQHALEGLAELRESSKKTS